MNRILVLMSTYNGEAYLREQIDSILFQSETADILIRDDGSSDQTISILEAYEKQYPQFTEKMSVWSEAFLNCFIMRKAMNTMPLGIRMISGWKINWHMP